MFPVPENLLKELNFDEIEDEKYKTFIRLEYQYIIGKEKEILDEALKSIFELCDIMLPIINQKGESA